MNVPSGSWQSDCPLCITFRTIMISILAQLGGVVNVGQGPASTNYEYPHKCYGLYTKVILGMVMLHVVQCPSLRTIYTNRPSSQPAAAVL